MTSKITGADIRRLRKACGIEIKPIARKIGYNAQWVSRIEKGNMGKKKVSVPEGFGSLFRDAVIEILDERKKMIQESNLLK